MKNGKKCPPGYEMVKGEMMPKKMKEKKKLPSKDRAEAYKAKGFKIS